MATEKKNAVWTKLGDKATIEFPDGEKHTFDFTPLSNTIFGYYGKKQWINDQSAGEQSSKDKIEKMKASYEEVIKNGVELIDGRIRVIGRARVTAKTQDSTVLEKFSTLSLEDLKALKTSVSLGVVKLSEELLEAVEKEITKKTKKSR